jgi:class 3 adenylate cyclase
MLPAKASGTLTFLFTDVEGSTRLWERFPQAMKRALERHDSILRAAVTAAGGQVVKTTGDGLMAVFGSAAEGVRACLAAQRGLVEEPWPETGVLRVRMGLHSGEAQPRGDDYFGPAVIRGARIMAVGHGGQVLLSGASAALVADQLPEGAALMDLGAHRLKDLGRPEELFQLVHPALLHDFPPLATPDRRPNNLPTQASTFIGRDTELREIRASIERESVRLLTLTGPGGTGKTRLALRVAADEIDRFDHGVFFIDLSAIRDTQAVLAGIARTVGLTETADRSLLPELERQLHHQRVLLVLDNFEQVMSAAPMAVELLSGCPRLKLLVTSREALHVRGEQLYAVPPLSPCPRQDVSRPPLRSLPGTRPFSCSSSAPRRSGPTSTSPTRTRQPLPTSACVLTACRWRSSWPQLGSICSHPRSCAADWVAGWPCCAAARAICHPGSARSAPRSSGATSFWSRANAGSSSCSRSSPGLASRRSRRWRRNWTG